VDQFYRPELFAWASVAPLSLAVLATCLIASSNYVLNELLDSRRDAFHPFKRHRPPLRGSARAVDRTSKLPAGQTPEKVVLDKKPSGRVCPGGATG